MLEEFIHILGEKKKKKKQSWNNPSFNLSNRFKIDIKKCLKKNLFTFFSLRNKLLT